MSNQVQQLVDERFLYWIVSPLERHVDCDVDEYPELNVPGLNSNDSEEVKHRVIKRYLVPWYESWTEESQTLLKNSLRYFLNVPSPMTQYGGGPLFMRIIGSGNWAFPDPDDSREFFVWIWEELYEPEDYKENDLSCYKEVDIEKINANFKLLRNNG